MAPSDTRQSRPPTEPAITSFLLGNLHCPTCVSAIKEVLHASCRDKIRWVSPNIVTAVVTVEHDLDAPISTMAAELSRAGFEICGVTTSAGDRTTQEAHLDAEAATAAVNICSKETTSSRHKGKQPAASSWLRSPLFGSRPSHIDAHLKNCEECRGKGADFAARPDPLPSAQETTRNLGVVIRPPAPSRARSKNGESSSSSASSSASSSPPIMSIESFASPNLEDAPIWRATVAIGGMTCAACSNAITKELSKRDWISNIAVNLITNSATVDFADRSKADKIVDEIEDLGYDAAIDTITNLKEEKTEQEERTVEISVDGMYCDHCPRRTIQNLETFGLRYNLRVDREPTHQHPIMKVTYVPSSPDFTIRRILASIEASDPAFKASIYHPPTLEERSKEIQRKHLRQIFYRVIFTGILCIPTFVLGIVYMTLLPDSNVEKHHLMMPWVAGISRLQIALFILATPVYFFAADMFHLRAFKEIWTLWKPESRTPILQRFYRFGSMNTLMSLGTTIAYVSSTSQLIAAAVYRPKEINDANFYFDAVVFLTFFLLLGRLIESYSKSKTGDAVEALAKLRPTTAILVEQSTDIHGQRHTEDIVVKTELLDFGDLVRIPHGTSPPADGIIVQGATSFDESSLTGESRPIKKGPGEEVYAGTVNKAGPVVIRITGVSGNSMLDQIVRIVREGQTKRAPMEQFADILTTYFVPCITLVAVVTWLVWLSVGLSGVIPGHFLDVTSGGWVSFSLQFAISVFVVACPCGLALAAPTAIFVGAGLAARYGILAKGGGLAFETASRIDCVVFDKTGTLTMGGEPKITNSKFLDGEKGEFVVPTPLIMAALKAIEENSSHTIAKAIVSYCSLQPLPTGQVEDLQEIPGKGMRAVFTPNDVSAAFEMIVGNKALMEQFSATVPLSLDATLARWTAGANSIALAAVKPILDKQTVDPESIAESTYSIRGALAISDPIRPESAAMIAALQSRGIQVYMLSGDNAATARAVGNRLGIDVEHVLAEVLPAQKADRIKYLQSTLKAQIGHKKESTTRRAIVAMVGDGVNDAPALAQADVGVAIGSGSDVAISSAGFVLVKSDLRNVLTLLELSKAVFRRIKLNFGWALFYNVLAVPVAAGVLYPVVGPGGQHVRLDPVWAALAMALSSISVVMSSLLLRSRLWIFGFRPSMVEVAEAERQEEERAGDDDSSDRVVVISSEINDDKI